MMDTIAPYFWVPFNLVLGVIGIFLIRIVISPLAASVIGAWFLSLWTAFSIVVAVNTAAITLYLFIQMSALHDTFVRPIATTLAEYYLSGFSPINVILIILIAIFVWKFVYKTELNEERS